MKFVGSNIFLHKYKCAYLCSKIFVQEHEMRYESSSVEERALFRLGSGSSETGLFGEEQTNREEFM
jgi:hypothetical protein